MSPSVYATAIFIIMRTLNFVKNIVPYEQQEAVSSSNVHIYQLLPCPVDKK
jgi:hypothetical protein